MRYIATVLCVDSSVEELKTTEHSRVVSWIKERDHEGSVIYLKVEGRQ